MNKNDLKKFNEELDRIINEDYSEIQNDKSLDKYREILNNDERIDDYVFFKDKTWYVEVKFNGTIGKDRKQVIKLDDNLKSNLDKVYNKCRKIRESKRRLNESDYEDFDEENVELNAALEDFELYVNEEIKPIANKLLKLLSLLNDIGAENRAKSLEDVLDYLNII